jgi:hypothetical protein
MLQEVKVKVEHGTMRLFISPGGWTLGGQFPAFPPFGQHQLLSLAALLKILCILQATSIL